MNEFVKRKPSTSHQETDSSGSKSGYDQDNAKFDACKKTKYAQKYNVGYIYIRVGVMEKC